MKDLAPLASRHLAELSTKRIPETGGSPHLRRVWARRRTRPCPNRVQVWQGAETSMEKPLQETPSVEGLLSWAPARDRPGTAAEAEVATLREGPARKRGWGGERADWSAKTKKKTRLHLSWPGSPARFRQHLREASRRRCAAGHVLDSQARCRGGRRGQEAIPVSAPEAEWPCLELSLQ